MPNTPPEVVKVDTSVIDPKPVAEPTLPSEQPTGEKLLAGKYKTAEELEKGYKELEKKLGQPPKPSTPPPPPPTKPGDPLKIDPTQASQVVADAGLNLEEFNKEFTEKGELGEASYEKLAKAGIPKAMVDAYIDGQRAIAESVHARVHSMAGGAEGYRSMIEWAATNLDADYIEAYNKAIGGSAAEQKFAVEALNTKFKAAVGSDPRLLKGSGPSPTAVGYASRAEMIADMKDPRYNTDPAYRAKVEAKVAKTSSF